jgi:hypothetical protein
VSLADVIADLGAATYQVTRTAVGGRVNGRYAPGASTTFSIVAGIEAGSGRDLQDLPEGRRGDEVVTIFTATPLIAIRPGVDPDVIRYLGDDPDLIALVGAGEPWTVIKSAVLTGLDGAHCEAMACRAPSPAGVVP